MNVFALFILDGWDAWRIRAPFYSVGDINRTVAGAWVINVPYDNYTFEWTMDSGDDSVQHKIIAFNCGGQAFFLSD